ncbi:hypothetical protein ACLOJK_003238 [Asimina triloba]
MAGSLAKLEELVAVGSRLLVGFRQELEMFRRPPLHETSKVAAKIIETNPTERLKAYVEAGCKHVPPNISKALLEELECLADDATGVAEATNGEFQHVLGSISGDGLVHHANCFEEVEEAMHTSSSVSVGATCVKEDTKMGCRQALQVSNHAITLRTIYNMVKLDFEMQERIVKSLDHSTPSEQLESYCLMWDLRPFIDEDALHRASLETCSMNVTKTGMKTVKISDTCARISSYSLRVTPPISLARIPLRDWSITSAVIHPRFPIPTFPARRHKKRGTVAARTREGERAGDFLGLGFLQNSPFLSISDLPEVPMEGWDPSTKSTLTQIPLLSTKAGPRDGAAWTQRLKEEYKALIAYTSMNKSNDNDWFRISAANPEGTRWTGKCWYVYNLLKYEFDLQFDIPVTYPATAPEIELPQLDGKTHKMYRGGKICLTVHFKPLWAKNCPRFGIAHTLCLGLAPWLAAEVPILVDSGMIKHKDDAASSVES